MRRSPPTAPLTLRTSRSWAASTSSAVSVRSEARYANSKAIDFFPVSARPCRGRRRTAARSRAASRPPSDRLLDPLGGHVLGDHHRDIEFDGRGTRHIAEGLRVDAARHEWSKCQLEGGHRCVGLEGVEHERMHLAEPPDDFSPPSRTSAPRPGCRNVSSAARSRKRARPSSRASVSSTPLPSKKSRGTATSFHAGLCHAPARTPVDRRSPSAACDLPWCGTWSRSRRDGRRAHHGAGCTKQRSRPGSSERRKTDCSPDIGLRSSTSTSSSLSSSADARRRRGR